MSQALPTLPPSVEQEPAKEEFSEPRSRTHRVGNWLLGIVPAFQSFATIRFRLSGLTCLPASRWQPWHCPKRWRMPRLPVFPRNMDCTPPS